jgi:K+-sensing histidine kinase KdpD
MSNPPEATKPIVKGLSKSIKEMSQHFDTLMDAGRFQDGSFEPSLSRVSLSDLSRRINLEIAPLCKDKGLNWIIDMEDALVFTDPELLLRLTRNLLINAVRYTPKGTVRCSAKIKRESVEFRLSDTGVGLTAEQQQMATSGIVKLQGGELHGSVHGLGLSIINRIDHALGLGLKISTSTEKGTVFTFQIPRITEF